MFPSSCSTDDPRHGMRRKEREEEEPKKGKRVQIAA
jgi:hypothetical protein